MKRILTILLTLALLFSLSITHAEAPKDTWLCETKTTLSVLCRDGSSTLHPTPSNDLPFWKWLEEYTNVRIEWEAIPDASWNEVLSTRLAAGEDLTDIIVIDNFSNARTAGENGLLVDLAPFWDTCFTDLAAYHEERNMEFLPFVQNPDGTIYAVAGSGAATENHIMFMYNTAWMEKLGAEIPTTLDEFTALCYKIQAAGDLNGNGEADEVVISAPSSFTHFATILASSFDMEIFEEQPAFAAGADGVVYPEYTTENMRNYLRYLNQLFTDGIIDPEIITMNPDKLSEKIASDRVGIFVYNSSFAPSFGALTPAGQEDPNGEHFTLGGPLASEYNGNKRFTMLKEKYSYNPTAITTSCENPELAARWLNTLMADPNVLRVRTCGWEGEDYYIDDNGDMQLIYPEDGSQWNIDDRGAGQITLCYIQTYEELANSMRQYDWYIKQYEQFKADLDEFRAASVKKSLNIFTDEEQEIINSYKTDITTYWNEAREGFMTGTLSLDDDWEDFKDTMDSLGLPEYTKAYQSIYDRTNG